MRAMFQLCNELKYLDLTNFNTAVVTDMDNLFSGCHDLKEIKGINNFDTSKVTGMVGMFGECSELEYLDLTNFNTSNVTDMECMFIGCHKLKGIKGINNFNNCQVTNMKGIFQECNELEYLDLSTFILLKLLIWEVCSKVVIN